MEPGCGIRAGRRGPRSLWASVPCGPRARALLSLLLLLLLLLGPPAGSPQPFPTTWPPAPCPSEGCEARGALPTAALADPGVPCPPGTTCPSGGPHLPQQAANTEQMPVSTTKPTSPSSCGISSEQDPTLRDPEAMARRWPWMVSVQVDGVHICAGTLIASRWVLTVAHCVTERTFNYTVRVGSPWIDQSTLTSSDIPVLQVILNSRYQAQRSWSWVGRDHDISLLLLERALKYSKYVLPICLPGLDYTVADGSVCTVTGWGYPSVKGGPPQFRTIQEKEVTILNSKECDDFYHRFSKVPSLVQVITSQMICASDDSRKEFCYEVTGEPLACLSQGTWYLVGMVSWGAGCKFGEAPPIFLKVSSYQVWIWDRFSGQPLAQLAPSRALLLALPLPLCLLAVL